MADSGRSNERPGSVRHRGFLDQWLTETDQERRLQASADSLKAVGKRLPQPRQHDSDPSATENRSGTANLESTFRLPGHSSQREPFFVPRI